MTKRAQSIALMKTMIHALIKPILAIIPRGSQVIITLRFPYTADEPVWEMKAEDKRSSAQREQDEST